MRKKCALCRNDILFFALAEAQGVDKMFSANTPNGIERGHINPNGINTFNIAYATATFTLTNVVPQYSHSNRRWAVFFEAKLTAYARDECGPRGGTLYVLSGSSKFGLDSSGNRKPAPVNRPQLKGAPGVQGVKVVIPASVWTAACCVWSQGRLLKKQRRTESVAALINNEQVPKPYASQMTIPQLENLLTDVDPVNLFPGNPQCRTNNRKTPL